jgi:hypothetical protein
MPARGDMPWCGRRPDSSAVRGRPADRPRAEADGGAALAQSSLRPARRPRKPRHPLDVLLMAGLLLVVPIGSLAGLAPAGPSPGRSPAGDQAQDQALPWKKAPGASPSAPHTPGYERADAKTLRGATREILAQPRFTKPESLWDRFWRWLEQWLDSLSGPRLDMQWDSGWGRFLFWFITLWCLLTLAAILGHLGWTIAAAVKRHRPRGAASAMPHFAQLVVRSEAELDALRQRLADQGRFREAIGVMMIVLLKRLHVANLLRFHESKTNGDYVVEFPRLRPGRDEFRRFVFAFDSTIYGGAACDHDTYARMDSLFEACLSYAR